jgi:hypothetical protein
VTHRTVNHVRYRLLAAALGALGAALLPARAAAQGDSARLTVTFRIGDSTVGPVDALEAVMPRAGAPREVSWLARLRGGRAPPSAEAWVTLRRTRAAEQLGRLAATGAARAPVGTCEIVATAGDGAALRTLVVTGCAVARLEPLPPTARAPAAVRVHLTFDRLASH